MTPQEFAAQLADQLATVIGTLVNAAAAAAPQAGGADSGRRWVATLGRPDAAEPCTVAFDDAGAVALAKVTSGVDDEAPESLVTDTLREVLSQALGALTPHDDVQGAPAWAVSVVLAREHTPADGASAFTISSAAMAVPLTVVVTGGLDLSRAVSPAVAANASAATGAGPSADRIDVILDIELPLVVRFGRTELPLRALSRLGPGSLIDLGRSADDPVELLVSNRVVARGEVVVVGGNYGVRVLDVVSPRSRMRSMEG